MKMKIQLYIGFFVLFTFVFSQLAFPLSARVKSISVRNAEEAGSRTVFDAIRSNTGDFQSMYYEYLVDGAAFEDIEDHHFIEYEVDVESTRFIPIDILESEITVNEKYKNRVLVRVIEPYNKQVSATKPSNKRFMLLIDTKGMAQEEILEMVKNIDIHITWKTMTGWERVNKVYLREETIVY